jgi:hypothetical protein
MSDNSLERDIKLSRVSDRMAFTKAFPKQNGTFPKWEEVRLTDEEVTEIEKISREDNIDLFAECLEDSKRIMKTNPLRPFETSAVAIAVSLFEKRASHTVFRKEQRAREKFDSL